jgi:hypothetical protein
MDLIGWLMIRSCFIIFLGPSCFFLRRFLFLSWGSLDEASQGSFFRLLSFTIFLLPSGPLAPSSHEVRCSLEIGQPNVWKRGMG